MASEGLPDAVGSPFLSERSSLCLYPCSEPSCQSLLQKRHCLAAGVRNGLRQYGQGMVGTGLREKNAIRAHLEFWYAASNLRVLG
jgi:hypothetical protein